MSGKGKPMTSEDAARIQSSGDKSGKDTGKGSFPAKAQSAAAKNVNEGIVPPGEK